MSTSIIYRHALLYTLATRVLYGRHHETRLQAIADLIPHGASVLDCCAGPGLLYERFLAPKAIRYTALDINPSFVGRLTRRGVAAEVRDLRDAMPLPRADYVVMHASLYHFLPQAAPIIERMLRAAAHSVIVAEPIRNVAASRVRWLASLGATLADPGTGAQPHRFTERSLDDLFAAFGPRVIRSFLIAGAREKVFVLRP